MHQISNRTEKYQEKQEHPSGIPTSLSGRAAGPRTRGLSYEKKKRRPNPFARARSQRDKGGRERLISPRERFRENSRSASKETKSRRRARASYLRIPGARAYTHTPASTYTSVYARTRKGRAFSRKARERREIKRGARRRRGLSRGRSRLFGMRDCNGEFMAVFCRPPHGSARSRDGRGSGFSKGGIW